MSVSNSRLSLVATLKDLPDTVDASSIPRIFFIAFTRPKFTPSLNVFVARNSTVAFAKEAH